MSTDASAKNMQAVCRAKEAHDKSCPWGGKGTEVHMAWFDIERMGWEEGDVICGLVVVGDETVATGMMRVTCDAEPDGGRREEEEQVEVVEAVSERELPARGDRPARLRADRRARARTRARTARPRARPPSGRS